MTTWLKSLIACAALLSVTSAEAQGYRELSVVPKQDTGIDLFAVASGATIEHRFRDDEGEAEVDFGGVESLTGEATDIAALALPDGRYELFIVDRNESLWHSWQQPDSLEWTEWQLLDNATKKVSVARDANGRVELFEIGSDDAVWHRGRAADAEPTDFGEWFRLETLGSQLAATAADGGGFQLAVIGQEGEILAQHFGADGQPDAEQESLGGQSFDVALATLPGGGYSLVAVGTVEDPWERRYVSAEQGWSDWQPLPVSANRVALVDTDAGLTLYGIANGAIVRSQLTAADAEWTEARVALEASACDSELQGRARLIIPSLDVDQDVPVTIGLRFNVDGTVEITSFPAVVTERFDTPFGATTSTVSLPRSGIGELRREDGVLRLPVTLRFDQSLDLPIIAEDGNLSLDLSSDNEDGQLLDPATGEVSLSAAGNFEGDGSTNPLDGQSCQVIVSGRLVPVP